MITMFAERGGVSARDIIRIAMGSDTNTRILAIKSGAAHASTVDPGGLVFAQKEGLISLGFLGDLFPDAVSGLRYVGQKNSRESRTSQAMAQGGDSRSHVCARPA